MYKTQMFKNGKVLSESTPFKSLKALESTLRNQNCLKLNKDEWQYNADTVLKIVPCEQEVVNVEKDSMAILSVVEEDKSEDDLF